jgi:hypothetical protein
MRYIIAAIFLGPVISAPDSFGQETKVNFIIQLNDQLVFSENMGSLQLLIETDEDKFNLDLTYWTGDLILSEEAVRILRQDRIKSATLMFHLYSWKKDKDIGLDVKTNFSKLLIEQPYVILNVFDLRDKVYRRQLGYLTKDDYICEYIIRNGGRLLRKR